MAVRTIKQIDTLFPRKVGLSGLQWGPTLLRLHSDMKDMSYYYVYKLYDELIEKGGLR